jgi:hypothetical protein
MEDLLFLILVLLCVVYLARALAAVIWSLTLHVAAPKAQVPALASGAVEPLVGWRVAASPSPHRSPPAASSPRSRIQGRGRESGVRDSRWRAVLAGGPWEPVLLVARRGGSVQQWHQGGKQP